MPLPVDRSEEHGPLDVIGDVHGCGEELVALLTRLGYAVRPVAYCSIGDGPGFRVEPPPGRKAVFVGDLCDRGPDTPAVLKLVMSMIAAGSALCVRGNHEEKLLKALDGRAVKVSKGLQRSLDQLAAEPPTFRVRVREFLDTLVSHYVFAGGELVVAHAGLPEHMHGQMSQAVTAFALYGDTTGESDADGFPVRRDWAQQYHGSARVVYGHVVTWEPKWINRTLCIDTGCVFGGRLTAWRYPEDELLDVPAQRVYFEPKRPLGPQATEPSISLE